MIYDVHFILIMIMHADGSNLYFFYFSSFLQANSDVVTCWYNHHFEIHTGLTSAIGRSITIKDNKVSRIPLVLLLFLIVLLGLSYTSFS